MPHIGEIWKHSKTGGEYEVINIGCLQVKSDLDMVECVIYKSLQDEKVWIRPVSDWSELVCGVPRFVKLR